MACIIIYLYISLLCLCSINSFDLDIQPNKKLSELTEASDNKKEVKQVKNEEKGNPQSIPVININTNKIDKKNKNVPSVGNTTTSNTLAIANNSDIKNSANTEIESGAVMRGIFVFVGITLLCIMYIAFKTYRKGTKKNVLIKKYGVRARRSDLEMEPLPLDEDEDDETVFDLGNVNNR